MFFSILFLTFIATPFIRFTVADDPLGDLDDANLFLGSDNNQFPSDDGSPLWDNDVGIGDADTDTTFLIDPNSFALNNDQTNSIELAELGDLCEAPPSKRSRREVCTPSDRQGQDQSIVNQLTFPNLFDVFQSKKKAPARETLGSPPFGDSPTGQDGNPCPAERPLHLCCLQSEMQWAEIQGLYINYFTLSLCSPGKFHGAE